MLLHEAAGACSSHNLHGQRGTSVFRAGKVVCGDVTHGFDSFAAESPAECAHDTFDRTNGTGGVVAPMNDQPIETAHGFGAFTGAPISVQGATNLEEGAVEDVFERTGHVSEIGWGEQ